MKKTFLVLLCLSLMLSGCQASSSLPEETLFAPTETLETHIQTAPSHLPLLEQGILQEFSDNLLYIPNEAIESMISPEVRLFGNGLLLSECTENELVLKHISLEDGTLVNSASLTTTSGTKLYIGSGEIGLCDRVLGQISILDEHFRPLRAYDGRQ